MHFLTKLVQTQLPLKHGEHKRTGGSGEQKNTRKAVVNRRCRNAKARTVKTDGMYNNVETCIATLINKNLHLSSAL